jgi:hypothetical protein
MTEIEIFALVSEKKKKIEELFDPTSFVLNKEIVKLQEEINSLQDKCQHKFNKDHICEYCGKEE